MADLDLETLNTPPSWCKVDPLTGRPTAVDRSACLEVRVSEVRRLAGCIILNRDTGKRRPESGPWPIPGERLVTAAGGPRRTGVFVITADMLRWLGSRRKTRTLRGDFRGTKANAMRPVGWTPGDPPLPLPEAMRDEVCRHGDWKGHRMRNSFGPRGPKGRRLPESLPTEQVRLENVLPGNPNRLGPFAPGELEPYEKQRQALARGGGGDSDRKVLGLPDDWCQPLRLERWTTTTGLCRPAYYLVCPGCGRTVGESIEPEYIDDPRLPGVSRHAWGSANSRRSDRDGQCPHRVAYLYLPLPTAAEWRDAGIAHLHFQSLPPRQRQSPDARRLAARYAQLFAPRTLRCRHCLGLRYGNHPEPARQATHRYLAKKRARQLKHQR